MVEKIRLSLWDIFSFLLTGLLAVCIWMFFSNYSGAFAFADILESLRNFPPALTLVAAPFLFTLIGILFEPIANYIDKKVVERIYKRLGFKPDRSSSDEKILEEEIRNKYLGSLSNRISSPYHLCKEYVETKRLSTTFMVFLSRYGFYRNCSVLAIFSVIPTVIFVNPCWQKLLGAMFLLFMASIFKWRSKNFFSYMAPAIYGAFLIDMLNWKGDTQIQTLRNEVKLPSG